MIEGTRTHTGEPRMELTEQRDLLRSALSRLIGASERGELEMMEMAIRQQSAPAEDKATAIDAIHALLATLPVEEA